MEKLNFAQTEVIALTIVVESMISMMEDDKKELLKQLTTSLVDGMIQSNPDMAKHFEEIKESVMRITEVGTVKP